MEMVAYGKLFPSFYRPIKKKNLTIRIMSEELVLRCVVKLKILLQCVAFVYAS